MEQKGSTCPVLDEEPQKGRGALDGGEKVRGGGLKEGAQPYGLSWLRGGLGGGLAFI